MKSKVFLVLIGMVVSLPAYAVCGKPQSSGSYECCEVVGGGASQCCKFDSSGNVKSCHVLDDSGNGPTAGHDPTCNLPPYECPPPGEGYHHG